MIAQKRRGALWQASAGFDAQVHDKLVTRLELKPIEVILDLNL